MKLWLSWVRTISYNQRQQLIRTHYGRVPKTFLVGFDKGQGKDKGVPYEQRLPRNRVTWTQRSVPRTFVDVQEDSRMAL